MNPHLVRAGTAGHEGRAVQAAAIVSAVLVAAAGLARSAQAQLVTPKTVPVFQNSQWDILPSKTAAMGGISIAIDDSIADPFINPAKATRVRGGNFFAAPFSHSITGNRGGGKTLPVGGLGSAGDWSFGGTFALQQLDRGGPMAFSQAISDRTATNQYLSAVVARRLGDDVSVGMVATFAALGAVDGVDLLYAGSDVIRQSGSSADVRLGLTKEFAGRKTLELIVLHNYYQNSHDAHWGGSRWDPVARNSVRIDSSAHNDDRTAIWGVHSEFSQPLGDAGWRIGYLGTVNQLSHPKIPNYSLQNVRRDPGSTLAFNAGVGLSRTFGTSTFGIDLIHEPMTSETWADAAHDTTIVGGGTIRAGGKTIENSFKFTNTLLRVGFGHELVSHDSATAFGFQLGLGLYSINYLLDQKNNVQKTSREQRESWMEWTPTLGFSFRTGSVQIHYNYSATCAVSDCLSMGDRVNVAGPSTADSGGGIIAAPSSALTFNGGTATIHKFWIAVPIR